MKHEVDERYNEILDKYRQVQTQLMNCDCDSLTRSTLNIERGGFGWSQALGHTSSIKSSDKCDMPL
jgi:hypothetical protein